MSLIPVSAAATVRAVPTGRPSPLAKAPASAPASRTHGPARSGGPAPGKAAKAKAGFASVLESVQQDDGRLEAGRSRSAVATAPRAERREDVAPALLESRETAPDTHARVGEAAPSAVATQTPWLLLALGNGSRSWQDAEGCDPSAEEDVVIDEAQGSGFAENTVGMAASPFVNSLPAAPVPVPPACPDEASALSNVGEALGNTTTVAGSAADVEAESVGTTPSGPEMALVASEEADVALPDELVAANRLKASVPDHRKPEAGDKTQSAKAADQQTRDNVAVPGPVEAEEGKPGASPAATAEAHIQPGPQSARPSSRAAAWLSRQGGTANPAAPSMEERPVDAAAPSVANAPIPGTREALQVDEPRSFGTTIGRRGPSEFATTAPVLQAPRIEVSPESVAAPTQMVLPDAAGEQVLNQIVTSVRMQWKDGIGEARLQLRPDALGTVNVTLKVEAGAVTAVVRADSPEVQEWVVKHQDTLRQQMESAGLNLTELVVTPDDRGQGKQEAPPQQRRQRQAVMAAQTKRFEELL